MPTPGHAPPAAAADQAWAARLSAIGRALAPAAIVLLPLLALLRLMHTHAVNIPFLDDWMYVEMDEKAKGGTLTLHDYFVAQMEHRMAFVRAVIMLFHKLWPANYVKQMWFTVALLAGTLANVAALAKVTLRQPCTRCWPALLLASLAIFSPVQYQIVLWAMMFQVACPAFFLSTALVALQSRMPAWLVCAICLLCAECATQSFSTGLILWPLVPVVFWLGGRTEGRKARIAFTAVWIAACALTMYLYLHNLHNEVDPSFAYKQDEGETLHRDFGAFFSHPGRSALFIVRFLGAHLARHTAVSLMNASLVAGAVSLAGFAGAIAWWVKNFRRDELRRAMLPWLAFGSYSAGAAVLVALGRVWASDSGDNALSPRYVIHAVPLTVSLIFLAHIVVRDVAAQRAGGFAQLTQKEAFAGAVLGCVLLINWMHGAQMMALWESSRLRVATNTMFYDRLRMFDGDIATKRDYARRANALGLLNPPMVRGLRADQFERSHAMLHTNTALWTNLSVERDGGRIYGIAAGYASLPRRERVADGVFLTWKDPEDAHWEIFHVAQVSAMPITILQTLSRDLQYIHVGGEINKEAVADFEGRFDFSVFDRLPKGRYKLAAWAFDYKLQKIFPISGFFEVDTLDGTVRPLGDNPEVVKHHRHFDVPKAETKE